MTTADERFEMLVSGALAKILEANTRSYLPDAVGTAVAEAVRGAASDPAMAGVEVRLIPGRTVGDLAKLPGHELNELCADRAREDPSEDLVRLLNSEEIGTTGSPLAGGMNSGASATLYAFDCNNLRYTYQRDFDGAGDQYVCDVGCKVDTDEGRAEFVDQVIGFFAYLWGNSECWVEDGIIPPERMDELRGDPWEHDVIEDYFRRFEPDDETIEGLARSLSADLDLEMTLARTFLTEMRDTGSVKTDHPLADRSGWWMIETQLR